MTIKSKTNNTNKPVETTPINNQFWVLVLMLFFGIMLKRDHPPVVSNGVWATKHSSPRELIMVKEPVEVVIFLKNSSDVVESMWL